jgi:thymidylate synthase (FAD)
MYRVIPQVFIVGETTINNDGLVAYLNHIGVPNWVSDAPSDIEKLIEVEGRLCYRSFEPGLNANVTRIREHNKDYLANIINVQHGSVTEHASVNFIFADVSRVFTHELVRHRAGVAISQESLRFVRLTDLGQWLPTAIREDEKVVEVFAKTFEQLEQLQRQLAVHFQLDNPKMPFAKKKTLTSAMRRIAPIGLATSIGWTANIRTIRWCLEMRTHPSAEEEIRLVFAQVGKLMQERFPNLFGDYEVETVDGVGWYKTKNGKI